MKLKFLVQKFSYNELVKVCKKKNWKIPTEKEIKGKKVPYDTFWITDPPEKQDRKTHAHIYQKQFKDGLQIANKHFLMNAVVIVEEKVCQNCKHYERLTKSDIYYCANPNDGMEAISYVPADFGCNRFERKETK